VARGKAIVDRYTQASLRKASASVWLNVCLDSLGCATVFLFLLLAIALHARAEDIALPVSYAAFIAQTSGWMFKRTDDLRECLASLAEMVQYQSMPEEEAGTVTGAHLALLTAQALPVQCVGVQMRYRHDIPPSLLQVSLTLRAGERVAVVGRTGSGKSTLKYMLLNMGVVDSGEVRIGGHTTRGMPAAVLRRLVGAIPQSPWIFHGTVRDNIDPHGRFSDKELFDALRCMCMDARVRALRHGLDTHATFSLGEQQLLAQCRVYLRRCPVVVLDEATSAVDRPTARLVTERFFASTPATVIVITHHLDEVLPFVSRVLAMDAGRVQEVVSTSSPRLVRRLARRLTTPA